MPGIPFNQSCAGVGRLWGSRQLWGRLVGGINCALGTLTCLTPVKHREKVKLSVSVVLILPRSLFPC